MLDATFVRPDLTTFCRLEELGLEAVGQRLEPDQCGAGLPGGGTGRVVPPVRVRGHPQGHADASSGARALRVAPHDAADHSPPLPLHRLRSRVAPRHQQGRASRGRSFRRGLRWALEGIVVQHLTIARIAEASGSRGTPPTQRSWPKDSEYSSTILPGSTG